eukprot:scaffold770_cov362-Pavlova_lutheri.AAC.9
MAGDHHRSLSPKNHWEGTIRTTFEPPVLPDSVDPERGKGETRRPKREGVSSRTKTEEGGSFSNEDRRESFFSNEDRRGREFLLGGWVQGSFFPPNLSREPKVNPTDLPHHGPSLPKGEDPGAGVRIPIGTDVTPTSASIPVMGRLWMPQPSLEHHIRPEPQVVVDDGARTFAAFYDVFAPLAARIAAEEDEKLLDAFLPSKRVQTTPGARQERCSRARTDLGAHRRERGAGARRGEDRETRFAPSCLRDEGDGERAEPKLTPWERCSCVRTSCRTVGTWNWWKWMD